MKAMPQRSLGFPNWIDDMGLAKASACAQACR
jgi:hypothetical protein